MDTQKKSDSEKTSVIHSLDIQDAHHFAEIPMKKSITIFGLVILVGVISGFIANLVFPSASSTKKQTTSSKQQPVAAKAGIDDKKTFKDSAEGIMKEGGIEGEGSFHLERSGGASQNVYLTSTTVDLSLYIDKKVKVWGETFSAEKAGWLMDVGLIELKD